jgi:Cu+-exporting ATPase
VDARGFTPARIAATASQPVTLAITRAATPNCGSRIVFPSLGIERDLPVGETTVIELPKLSGDLAFACGMGMFRGLIVARYAD